MSGKRGNRSCFIDKGGKSGLYRRGYQRKAGGCKATESITENIPLFSFKLDRQGEMPTLREGSTRGNSGDDKPYPKQDRIRAIQFSIVLCTGRLSVLVTIHLDE